MKQIRLYKAKQTRLENEADDKNTVKRFSWKKKKLLYCIVDYREDCLFIITQITQKSCLISYHIPRKKKY